MLSTNEVAGPFIGPFERRRREHRKAAKCFTGSRVWSMLTIGDVVVVMYLNEVVASIYIHDGRHTLVRHTAQRGICGLTNIINRALYAVGNGYGTKGDWGTSSREWDNLPVIPFEQYEPKNTNVEPHNIRHFSQMYRVLLTQAIVMADDSDSQAEGLRLLESLDEMVKDRFNGVRTWYRSYIMSQIEEYLRYTFKDVEVPYYYK